MIPKRWLLLISIPRKTLVLAEQYATIVEMTTTDDEKEKDRRSFMFCLTSCIINIEEKHLSFHLTDESKRNRDDDCFTTIFFSSFTVSTFGWMMNGAKCLLIFFPSFTGIVAFTLLRSGHGSVRKKERELVAEAGWTLSKGMLFILISRRLQEVLWTGVESKKRSCPGLLE
jgi:hypothetical protein